MKSIYKIIASFKKEYKDIPGIIEIQEGNSNGEPILVFIDKSKLKSILPSSYEGITISYIDLIALQNETESALKNIANNKSFLSDEKTVSFLTKTNNLCKKLLQKDAAK